jgi:hypothetical protein
LPKDPATVPVDGNATGLPAGGVVNHDPHPSRNRAPLRSHPHGRRRSLNPGRLHNPLHGPRHSRNHSPARPRSPLRDRLRSHNLGLCPNPRLVRWLHLPNRSLSPAPFLRTRSIRRLPPAKPVWAVLREVPRGIALVQATWVA